MTTSKERVMAAVAHRATDRVPITFDAEKEVFASLYEHFGFDTREALFDRLGCDTWMLLPGNFLNWNADADQLEKTSIWGWKTKVTPYSGGTYDELVYSPLAGESSIADIEKHPWPDAGALDFSGFAADAAAHADRAIIGTFTWGAYFIASFLRSLEDLMMDFALNRDYARCLIDTVAERSLAFLDVLLEKHGEGIDIVYMADDYCSQAAPLFSPAAFKEFVVPYLTRVVDRVHKHDKVFLLHVCGAVRPLLPMIVDAGVDMLEPIQVRAEGMDPQELRREFGKDLCFYGGVDLQDVLCHGTPQTVADEVKRLIDILGAGGGYVLGPGHTYIQVDAPIENILAMYDTAQAYR